MEEAKKVAKAIIAGVGAGLGTPAAMLVTIPDGVVVPWWGYLIAGAVNAAWIGFTVWAVPNKK